MDKIDRKFIISNKTVIVRHCFINALCLRREAGILMDKNAHARAHFLIIAALEEIAKAVMIMNKEIETKGFKSLVDHKSKALEIVKIIANYFKYNLTEDAKKEMSSRIVRMREDALYTRLKPTPENQFRPDDKYWEKRAKVFCNYLDKYITDVSRLIGKYHSKKP